MDTDDKNIAAPTPVKEQAPMGLIVLMWAVTVCSVATIGYFFADYMAARSELTVVERQIHSIESMRG